MRTTLSLDDDIFAFVRAQAQRERLSIGEALSRLARLGIQAQRRGPVVLSAPSSRFALLPARAETITPQHVRQLIEQEGL